MLICVRYTIYIFTILFTDRLPWRCSHQTLYFSLAITSRKIQRERMNIDRLKIELWTSWNRLWFGERGESHKVWERRFMGGWWPKWEISGADGIWGSEWLRTPTQKRGWPAERQGEREERLRSREKWRKLRKVRGLMHEGVYKYWLFWWRFKKMGKFDMSLILRAFINYSLILLDYWVRCSLFSPAKFIPKLTN